MGMLGYSLTTSKEIKTGLSILGILKLLSKVISDSVLGK